MQIDWHPVRSLLGGTRAMRKAGTDFLPKEEAESEKSYKNRLGRSFLYAGLKNAVAELTSKPFQKPVEVKPGLGPILSRLEKSTDRLGTSLTNLFRRALSEKIAFGKYHILVDSPSDQPSNAADEEKRDLRPYFVFVPADAVIGWKTKIIDSREILVDVRILETLSIDVGMVQQREERIRRWFLEFDEKDNVVKAGWEIYRSDAHKNWTLESSGDNPLKEIPLVVDYAHCESMMVARPPLQEIADLNIAHWQSSSDQRNILRFARAPIIWRSGVAAEEKNDPIVVGAGASFASTVAGATMNFVEHSGSAVESGAKDLADLEQKMRVLALQPLVDSGNPTATGAALDEARTNCVLKTWVRDAEVAFRKAYEFASKWADEKIPENWEGIDVFDEFGLSIRAAEDTRQLTQMRKDREITRKTFLSEVKRRGLLSDTFDVEQEIKDLEDEGPDLSDLSSLVEGLRGSTSRPAPNTPGPNGPSGPPDDPAQRPA